MESFAAEFEYILNKTDTSVRRLSRLSGIPRRTLENWLYGRTQRPRHVETILQVARTLHLPVHDTDRLLQAAGYPAVAQLQQSNNAVPAELLHDWQLQASEVLKSIGARLVGKQHDTVDFGEGAISQGQPESIQHHGTGDMVLRN